MSLLLMLVLLAATPTATTGGTIEATIQGTKEPLEVELLFRDAGEQWRDAAKQSLPAETRHVRFDGLPSGVYQLRLRGPRATEQLGTKLVVGRDDVRRITIAVAPFFVTGRITLGGKKLDAGTIELRHQELHWSAAIPVGADGTFRAPLWQRGAFDYGVRGASLPTAYTDRTEIDGPSALTIAIPDGRITGIVRDAKSGAPVGGAGVALKSSLEMDGEEQEENVTITTGADGRFDFIGIKYGQHTVRVFPPHYLEPEPVTFPLTADAPRRELDLPVDAGQAVSIVVIDRDHDPAANAKVLAVADSRLLSRATTDEDGRTTIAVPAGVAATLFVIPEEGPFGILRLARDRAEGRVPLHLPRTTSSLMIRTETTTGAAMPPVSLLMRYNGELVPPEVADELATLQGLELATHDSEAHLENIPSGSYEFWPYRTETEARSIVEASSTLLAPIQVDVRAGENKIAVKFAGRRR